MLGKQKICLIKPEVFKADGALRVTANLLSELASDYDFDLVGIYGEPQPYYEIPSSVNVSCLNESGEHLRDNLVSSVRKLRSLVSRRRFDVVICVGCSTFLHAYTACLGKTTKVILWEHMNLEANDGNLAFRKLAARHADAIVTLTKKDAENYSALVGKRKIPVAVIPNWVNAPSPEKRESRIDGSANAIVSVGRLSKQKGLDLLVEVADSLRQQNVNFVWDCYGAGELENEFRAEIERRHLEKHVRLMGTVPDVVSRLSDYSIFALTSRWEGLPMVLLETLSQHTPPIAFDIPTGPADIIVDGVNGFLIEPFDTTMMAERIKQVLDDDELRESLSANSTINMSAFSKDTILRGWQALLDSFRNTAYFRIS